MTTEPDRTAEQIASGLLAAFFNVFGWFALIHGSVALKGKSGAVSVIDGSGALAVAGFAFLISSLGAVLLLRSLGFGRAAYAIAVAAVLALPFMFAFFSRFGGSF